jgi:hypothetical protein
MICLRQTISLASKVLSRRWYTPVPGFDLTQNVERVFCELESRRKLAVGCAHFIPIAAVAQPESASRSIPDLIADDFRALG